MDNMERVDMIVFQTCLWDNIRYMGSYSTSIVQESNVSRSLKFKEIYAQFKIEWDEFKPWQKGDLIDLRQDLMNLNEAINQQLLSLGNVSSGEQPYTSNDPTDDGT